MLKLTIGLQLARLADLPKNVLTHAGKIANDLRDESARGHEGSESCKVARRRKAVLKVCCGTRNASEISISIINLLMINDELPDENNINTSF